MMRRKMLLVFCFMAFCLSGTPAFADMFDFDASVRMTFDGATLNGYLYGLNEVKLNRLDAPTETVIVGPKISSLGDFAFSMNVDNIDNIAETATGTGTFTLTDVDGDTITGDMSGNWAKIGSYTTFNGDLTNVLWNTDDGLFNGDSGSGDAAVALDSLTSPPWRGPVELTIDHAGWLLYTSWGALTKTGSVSAIVPTPAAVLLGILGLGTVGIRLRKYA